jgi:anti-sigma-K factor RskA
MTCDERKDLFLDYALGALDADDPARAELERHLRTGCPACAGHLAEARALVGQIPAGLERVAPPADHFDRVLDRIGRGGAAGVVPIAPPVRPPAPTGPTRDGRNAGGWWRTLGTAAVAAGLAVAVTVPVVRSRHGADVERRLIDSEAEIRELRFAVENANQQIRQVRGGAVRLITLKGAGPQPNAKGLAIWEPRRSLWVVHTLDLKRLPEGRAYQLWYSLADGRKVPPQTIDKATAVFNTDAAKGEAWLITIVPPELAPQLIGFAISDEPPGGSPAPTGTVHAVGVPENF